MKIVQSTNRLRGDLVVPGDKSISHRAIMLGAIAEGRTQATGVLDCDDCNHTIGAFRAMGVSIAQSAGATIIEGKGLRGLKKPSGALAVGESGTTMRLLPGILAGQPFEASLEGAPSLARRPMRRIVEPLSLMGVDISSADGYPPLTVRGGAVRPIDYTMPIPSAQVKSAILFAGLYAGGVTSLEEAFKSRDHTERMMAYFGGRVTVSGRRVSLEGGAELSGKSFDVPGDISSAAFFMVGATIVKNAKVRIANVSVNPTRAGVIDIMKKMGARISVVNVKDRFEPSADIEVESAATCGITIGEEAIPGIIDELPVIFVLAALSKGRTVIRGAGELKVKETDRIRSMQENLRAMGARFEIDGEDIVIEGSCALTAARLKSFGDHRTCMAMAIAALAAKGESEIDDASCVSKSFPGFFEALKNLGAGN